MVSTDSDDDGKVDDPSGVEEVKTVCVLLAHSKLESVR